MRAALLLCLALLFSACATSGNTTEEILAAQIESARAQGAVISSADSLRLVTEAVDTSRSDSLRAAQARQTATSAEAVAVQSNDTLTQIERNTRTTAIATSILAILNVVSIGIAVLLLAGQ